MVLIKVKNRYKELKMILPKELAEYEQTWINMENVSKNLDEQYSKRKSKKR